jgi:hypothetical protein
MGKDDDISQLDQVMRPLGWEIAHEDDPCASLSALGVLLDWVEDVECELVAEARSEGASWALIGHYLGRSKQAVWAKHAAAIEELTEV